MCIWLEYCGIVRCTRMGGMGKFKRIITPRFGSRPCFRLHGLLRSRFGASCRKTEAERASETCCFIVLRRLFYCFKKCVRRLFYCYKKRVRRLTRSKRRISYPFVIHRRQNLGCCSTLSSADDTANTPYLYSCETLRCRKSFFLVFLAWPHPPTHCRYRCSLLKMITLSDTHTLGRTPLDEGAAYRSDFYLTTHIIHKRHNQEIWHSIFTMVAESVTANTRMRKFTLYKLRSPIYQLHYCHFALTKST